MNNKPFAALKVALAASLLIAGSACAQSGAGNTSNAVDTSVTSQPPVNQGSAATQPFDNSTVPAGKAVAIFAGGCFWCMEPPFDALDGVESTISGYTNGQLADPGYKQVSAGYTGHTEAVKIVYDPAKISYQQLLDVFWVNVDPTAENRQFCDSGSQYRSGIYPVNEEQRRLAVASKQQVEKEFSEVYTEIESANTYYDAEDYHQDYYQKNPIRYKYYRYGCGRDKQLEDLWGSRYQHQSG